MIIENRDSSVFEVVDSGFVMNIKKPGFYWIYMSATNNSNQASLYGIFWSTTSPTSGYSIINATQYVTVVQTMSAGYSIYEFTTPNTYLMVGTSSAQSPYMNMIVIERVNTDSTVINQVTNNYTNPPLK